MKHTPGPWKVCEDGTSVYSETEDVIIHSASIPDCDPALCVQNGDEEFANAYLIAASPEMLEVLKEVSQLLSELKTKDKTSVRIVKNMVDEVISKVGDIE